MNEFTLELGASVRDTITGFEGKITARVQHLFGQNRYCVEGVVVEDGKMPSDWLDEGRLETA